MVDFAMTTATFWLVYMITNIVVGYTAAGPPGISIDSSRYLKTIQAPGFAKINHVAFTYNF